MTGQRLGSVSLHPEGGYRRGRGEGREEMGERKEERGVGSEIMGILVGLTQGLPDLSCDDDGWKEAAGSEERIRATRRKRFSSWMRLRAGSGSGSLVPRKVHKPLPLRSLERMTGLY